MPTVVSLVSYRFLPARSGGEKCIALFFRYFSAIESLMCIGTRSNDAAAAEGRYEVIPLFGRSPWRYVNPLYYFRIRRILRRKKATHLLIEHPYLGWLGIWLQKTCGVKLVVQSHNIEGLRWKSLGKWWWELLWTYERHVHRQADFSFFITPEDMAYAQTEYGVPPARTGLVTYGTELAGPPAPEARHSAAAALRERHHIGANTKILLFNGAFGNRPNREALASLLSEVVPRLQQKGFDFRLLVCGGGIPGDLLAPAGSPVDMPGFVPDIADYLLGADLFVNPVRLGGGIKTKLVEAVGYGLPSVSTASGAFGIDPALCGGKLTIAADGDWDAFADAVLALAKAAPAETPAAFYRHFYWGNCAADAAKFIA